MKKIFLILSLIFLTSIAVFAQDEGNDYNDKIQDKLKEYLQKRLGLSSNEAEKFSPVFGRYLLELRKTHRDNTDPLLRQQRIAELRLHYRDEFRPIVGEQKAGKVFVAEQEFRQRVKELLIDRKERMQESRPNRRFRSAIQ